MRLLIITNKLPYPPKDGGSIATLSLAVKLSQLTTKTDILAINTSKHYFPVDNIPVDLTKHITFYDFFLNTDIKLTKLVTNLLFSKIPYNAERFISEDFNNKLTNILEQNQYDIVQFEGLYVLPYIKIVKEKSNAIISFRAHNIEHEIWERLLFQTKNPIKKIYLKIIFNRLKKFELSYINKYDLILPITDRDATFFNNNGNKKPLLTVPTGIEMKEYISDEKEETDISVFHIGALDWAPNQEGLLWFIKSCWPEITKQCPNLKFFIAGRNAPDWFVKKLDSKNIEYLGEVEDAKKFMNEHSVMIVPLLSGSGMRIKIIEAMALGKAVISTKIGAEGINAANKKEIIIADNSNEFVNTITNLVNEPFVVKDIGENAKSFITKNFDNFAIAKELVTFYKNNTKTGT